MPLFGTRRTRTSTVHSTRSRHSPFHRKDRNRVAAGYKSALSNPHTTKSGRKQAKRELRAMGRANETHVPFMTKVKRALGIRSSPRRTTVVPRTRY